MKQINNGYDDCYYLTKDGEIYNNDTKKYLQIDDKHRFRLKTKEEGYKKVTLREIYWIVYNEWFCKDDIKDLEDEEWKEIEGTNKIYYVSNKGRIKSRTAYKAKILKPTLTKNGYYRVDISFNGERKSKLVHRLVAAAFLDPPKSIEDHLHHKDFNKLNNVVENLEWLNILQHAKKHQERKDKGNSNVSEQSKSENDLHKWEGEMRPPKYLCEDQ